MMTMIDLARISGAVYGSPPTAPEGWTMGAVSPPGGIWHNLQAAIYEKQGGGTAVAFRGTNLSSANLYGSAQDLHADITLGVGQNIARYAAAEDFMRQVRGRANLVVCGHSLGGAIAQVVGNRLRLRIATFNAPGVGVVASRNLGEVNPFMGAVRVVGMVAGAVGSPMQAWSDVTSAFHWVQGVNLRLDGDLVSAIGAHYGRLVTIAGPAGAGRLQQHFIDSVLLALAAQPRIGGRDVMSFE